MCAIKDMFHIFRVTVGKGQGNNFICLTLLCYCMFNFGFKQCNGLTSKQILEELASLYTLTYIHDLFLQTERKY